MRESLSGTPFDNGTSVPVVAACVTVNVFPAMVKVPARELALVLAVTDQVTDPLPVPLAGVQVNQLVALLDAVQLQPVPAVTVTVPLPAAEAGLALVAEIEYVHEVDPACVTIND